MYHHVPTVFLTCITILFFVWGGGGGVWYLHKTGDIVDLTSTLQVTSCHALELAV